MDRSQSEHLVPDLSQSTWLQLKNFVLLHQLQPRFKADFAVEQTRQSFWVRNVITRVLLEYIRERIYSEIGEVDEVCSLFEIISELPGLTAHWLNHITYV